MDNSRKKLKILIVSTYDIAGGAGKAAYRLHLSLIKAGVDSKMLVLHKRSHDGNVIGTKAPLEFLFKLTNRISKYALVKYQSKSKSLFSNSLRIQYPSLVSKINAHNPDVVHLHWTSHSMLNIEHVEHIKAPIVWSLHDMWAFTGGCHYDLHCNRYIHNCGSCKVLNSPREVDISTSLQARKIKAIAKIANLTVVGLSRWIEACASSSTVFKGRKMKVLPNPIDLELYKPIDKEYARQTLNLPLDRKLILFGAMDSTTDLRKGFLYLATALTLLNNPDVEVVIFGSDRPSAPPIFIQKAHYLGHVTDETKLSVTYSACDVMIVPSIQENLSNAIMESLACATPVVAFNIGGNSDLIDHQKNGFLVEKIDAVLMAAGIKWILENGEGDILRKNARLKAERCFEQSRVANNYIELYKSILT